MYVRLYLDIEIFSTSHPTKVFWTGGICVSIVCVHLIQGRAPFLKWGPDVRCPCPLIGLAGAGTGLIVYSETI